FEVVSGVLDGRVFLYFFQAKYKGVVLQCSRWR
ncbi:unnamed protein product, partial [Coregonus sp. 'balchen']